jgi:hypothetical protein
LDGLPPLPEPLKNADWAVVDYNTFDGRPAPGNVVWPEDDPRSANAQAGWENIDAAVKAITQHVVESMS